jgi:hypothetical protein
MASSLNILRAGLSGGILVGVEHYVRKRGQGEGGALISMGNGKRFLAQGVSSLSSNTAKGFILPMLPASAQGASDYIVTPVVVGGMYTLLTYLFKGIDGGPVLKRFLISAGSELVASYAEVPIRSWMAPGRLAPGPGIPGGSIKTQAAINSLATQSYPTSHSNLSLGKIY